MTKRLNINVLGFIRNWTHKLKLRTFLCLNVNDHFGWHRTPKKRIQFRTFKLLFYHKCNRLFVELGIWCWCMKVMYLNCGLKANWELAWQLNWESTTLKQRSRCESRLGLLRYYISSVNKVRGSQTLKKQSGFNQWDVT